MLTGQAHLELPLISDVLNRAESFVQKFAAQHGISNDDCSRALIVVEELLTNLLKYGCRNRAAGTAEITLALEGGRLSITLTDDGDEFDPFAAPVPQFNQPLEARPLGGLGLQIVRLLAEGKSYSRIDDRNVTRLTLTLHPRSKE